MHYSLYENELYSDANDKLAGSVSAAPIVLITPEQTTESQVVFNVKAPHKWSAEQPYRYTLVAELKDKRTKR